MPTELTLLWRMCESPGVRSHCGRQSRNITRTHMRAGKELCAVRSVADAGRMENTQSMQWSPLKEMQL